MQNCACYLVMILSICFSVFSIYQGRSANERSIVVQDFFESLTSQYPYWNRTLSADHFFVQDKAHLFPISNFCHSLPPEEKNIENYVKNLIAEYRYWNRTLGADHFFFSCIDFSSWDTEEVLFLLKNAIRLVCSPSYDSKYVPQKDISLPQILEPSLPDGDDVWSRSTVDSRPVVIFPEIMLPRRAKLGFWAGSPNSEVRQNLLFFYKGDQEFHFHFFSKIKKASTLNNYQNELYGSKFCICPPGKNQLGGVCLTESMTYECVPDHFFVQDKAHLFPILIHCHSLPPEGRYENDRSMCYIAVPINNGCVPVIMSDYYDLPFHNILDGDHHGGVYEDIGMVNEHKEMIRSVLRGIPGLQGGQVEDPGIPGLLNHELQDGPPGNGGDDEEGVQNHGLDNDNVYMSAFIPEIEDWIVFEIRAKNELESLDVFTVWVITNIAHFIDEDPPAAVDLGNLFPGRLITYVYGNGQELNDISHLQGDQGAYTTFLVNLSRILVR